MARVTGSCTGGWGSKYNYYLDYTLNSQSVANNTSNITLTAWAQASATNYQANNSSTTANTYKVYIDGANKVSSTKAMDFRNRAVVSLGSWTGNVAHNADGTKAINIGGAFTISGTSSLSGGSVSANWALPTIARASTPTLTYWTNQNLGSTVTIYTNRASTNFTHTIEVFFGNWYGVVAYGVHTSQDWVLPHELANQIPTSNGGAGIIRLATYNGGTLIGYKDINFNVEIPYDATFNPTASGINAWIAGSGYDTEIGNFVQGISKAGLSFTPTARMGAWITSNYITIEGIGNIYGTNIESGILYSSGEISVSATVVDSRGRTHTQYGSIIIRAYNPPKITNLTVTRIRGTNSAKVEAQCTFIKFGVSNVLSYSLYRDATGLIWDDNSSGVLNYSYTDAGAISTKSHTYTLHVGDSFGNYSSSSTTIGTEKVPISYGGNEGIGVGKIWEQGALDVSGEVYVDGMVTCNNIGSSNGIYAEGYLQSSGTLITGHKNLGTRCVEHTKVVEAGPSWVMVAAWDFEVYNGGSIEVRFSGIQAGIAAFSGVKEWLFGRNTEATSTFQVIRDGWIGSPLTGQNFCVEVMNSGGTQLGLYVKSQNEMYAIYHLNMKFTGGNLIFPGWLG